MLIDRVLKLMTIYQETIWPDYWQLPGHLFQHCAEGYLLCMATHERYLDSLAAYYEYSDWELNLAFLQSEGSITHYNACQIDRNCMNRWQVNYTDAFYVTTLKKSLAECECYANGIMSSELISEWLSSLLMITRNLKDILLSANSRRSRKFVQARRYELICRHWLKKSFWDMQTPRALQLLPRNNLLATVY